jgi:glycosyltransferase involved in cell wall biosynthesis
MSKEIGVFIPTYNRADVINECISSLLNQTYRNFKIFIVDNASTDQTEQIVKSMMDNRIIYIRNNQNIGAINNFNKCIKIALEKKIEIFTIYHSDDVYSESILDNELSVLYASNEIGAVFSKMYVSELKNDKDENLEATIFNKDSFLDILLSKGTPLYCPTFMCKTEIFEKVQPFSNDYEYFGDTEFYLRLSEKYQIALLNKPLAFYRISKGQESYIQRENLFGLTEEHKYIDGLIKKRNFKDDIIKKYKQRVSKEYLSYSLESIKANLSEKVIDDKILISISYFSFSIFNKFGLIQRIIKYKFYWLIRIIAFIMGDK